MGGIRSIAVRQFPGAAKITDPHVILGKTFLSSERKVEPRTMLCVHREQVWVDPASLRMRGPVTSLRGIATPPAGRYTSPMMCTDCRKHKAVYGHQCLYCRGDHPPKDVAHRLWVCLQSYFETPIHLFHRTPDLVR